MKRPIIFFLLLTLSIASFSQQTQFSKEDYLEKSKKQKTTAWILLGGGTALTTIGILIDKGEFVDYGIYPTGPKYKNDGVKAGFGVVGVLSILGSIPLFIASSKNQKKTINMSFRLQKVPQLPNTAKINQPIPSLNLKISL